MTEALKSITVWPSFQCGLNVHNPFRTDSTGFNRALLVHIISTPHYHVPSRNYKLPMVHRGTYT